MQFDDFGNGKGERVEEGLNTWHAEVNRDPSEVI